MKGGKRWILWVIVGVVALGMLVCAFSMGFVVSRIAVWRNLPRMQPQQPPGRMLPPPMGHQWLTRHGAYGKVDQVDADTITIIRQDGTTQVIVVTGETRIEQNGSLIALDDVEPGKWVVAIGTPGSDEGRIVARIVRVLNLGPK